MRFPFVDEDDPYIEEEISYYVSKIEDEESEMVRRMKEKERKKQLEMETEMEFLSSDEDPAIEDDDDPPIGKEVSYVLFMMNLNSFLQSTASVGDEESEMRRRMNEKEREKQEFFWFDDDKEEGEPVPSSVLDPSLEQAKGKEIVHGELPLADDDKEEGEPVPSSVLDPSLEQAKGKEIVHGELPLADDDKEEGEPVPSSVLDPSLEQAKGKEAVYDKLPLADDDKEEGEPEPSSVLAPSVEQGKGKEVVHDDELPLADDDKEEGEPEPSSALDPSAKQAKGKEVVYGLPLAVGGDSWAASALLGLRNCDDPMIGFLAEEAKKMPCLGDKEPVSALAADFPSDCSIIQEKIKLLGREYSSFRRARRDGNCFYRSFIFSYLEQVVGMQDDSEVYRILGILNQFRQTNQRKTVNTFDDFYSDFTDLMVNIMEWKQTSTSFGHEQLLRKSRGEKYSSNMLAFFRLITSFEICTRAEHYKPFLPNMKSKTMEEFCRAEVIPMAVEADHVQIIALAYALKVPMRVVEIDSSSTLSGSGSIEVNQQDLLSSDNSNTRNTETSDHGLRSIPQLISSDSDIDTAASRISSRSVDDNEASSSNSSGQQVPFVTLLYRPGHYDILYPK